MKDFSGPELFSKEQTEVILARLQERAKDVCPSCGNENLVVIQGIAMISMVEPRSSRARLVLPNIVVICPNCGLTQLFNVHALGLAEVLGLAGPGEPIAEDSEGVGRQEASHG